jgi:ribosomal RNA-processing protein 8
VIPEKRKKKQHIAEPKSSPQDSKPLSYQDKLRESLKGSRFRFINEQLYSNPSVEAVKIFEEDESAFTAYHEGYRHQVNQWPMNPLDRLIKQINKM